MTRSSLASCTTTTSLLAKALNDYAPIQSGIMSTIHAYTGDQMILDGPHRKGDLRGARAGAVTSFLTQQVFANIIGLIIPEPNVSSSVLHREFLFLQVLQQSLQLLLRVQT